MAMAAYWYLRNRPAEHPKMTPTELAAVGSDVDKRERIGFRELIQYPALWKLFSLKPPPRHVPCHVHRVRQRRRETRASDAEAANFEQIRRRAAEPFPSQATRKARGWTEETGR